MSEFTLFMVLVQYCGLFPYWGGLVRCVTIEDIDLIGGQHTSPIASSLLGMIRLHMIRHDFMLKSKRFSSCMTTDLYYPQ